MSGVKRTFDTMSSPSTDENEDPPVMLPISCITSDTSSDPSKPVTDDDSEISTPELLERATVANNVSASTPTACKPSPTKKWLTSVEHLIAMAKVKQILWTCEIRNDIETTSQTYLRNFRLSGDRKTFKHMRKISQKAFTRINNHRDLKGAGTLEWCEQLYEICYLSNTEMTASRILDDHYPRIGVKALNAVLRIAMEGEGVESRKKGYISERVSSAVLTELQKRRCHERTLHNTFMRYGSVDIFGTEEDFVVTIVFTRYPPFYFNQSRRNLNTTMCDWD